MDVHIGLKHAAMVKLRDELTKAIDSNPDARDGGTSVVLYGRPGKDGGEHYATTLTIANDDCERDEVSAEEIYVEVTE